MGRDEWGGDGMGWGGEGMMIITELNIFARQRGRKRRKRRKRRKQK